MIERTSPLESLGQIAPRHRGAQPPTPVGSMKIRMAAAPTDNSGFRAQASVVLKCGDSLVELDGIVLQEIDAGTIVIELPTLDSWRQRLASLERYVNK